MLIDEFGIEPADAVMSLRNYTKQPEATSAPRILIVGVIDGNRTRTPWVTTKYAEPLHYDHHRCLVDAAGIEPAASSVSRKRSSAELYIQ